MPERIQYEIYLSDSCLSAFEKYGQNAPAPDLDAVVHVYDFKISHEEFFRYIEEAVLPGRFDEFDNDLRN